MRPTRGLYLALPCATNKAGRVCASFQFIAANELMITFTPLSGAARSDSPSPLSYLLQVDDVRMLLDCGSPDWAPENDASTDGENESEEPRHSWSDYCETLRRSVLFVFIAVLCSYMPFSKM